MPEYLAPGVYVEEVSYRSKSIEGVSTTTTGFIGPCRYGPVDLNPDILTSLGDFERTYGDRQQLRYTDASGSAMHNYLWHAARAFFEEGGKRLYVARIFRPSTDTFNQGIYARPVALPAADYAISPASNGDYPDGHARGWLDAGRAGRPSSSGNTATTIQVRARFPGAYGNLKVRFTLRAGRNILIVDTSGGQTVIRVADSLQENDIVWIGDVTSPISSPPGEGAFYRAEWDEASNDWRFRSAAGAVSSPPGIGTLIPGASLSAGHAVHIVTVTVTAYDKDDLEIGAWPDLPLEPLHQRAGAADSLFARFEVNPASGSLARQLPIVILRGTGVASGLDAITALFRDALDNPPASPPSTPGELLLRGVVFCELTLRGGNDGRIPTGPEYEGNDDPHDLYKTGLKQFEDIEDISIVAAPGATQNFANRESIARDILGKLVSHASRMRYRIAVLDSGDQQSVADVRDLRAKFDSTYAALYYPWVQVMDPVTRREINLPPSGFVAGIYARNDIIRAVYKAPANEVVNLAIGFETMLNRSQQEVLNPEGINCFRYFEGRGMLLWGARTISSDPEWKYVNLRRYFAYLERSIDKGTQWAVFEPNGERLWANVRRTIEDFLLNEWQNGALLGDKPEKAYFVKCDRGTMSQNDLDNGRLVCQIGVAALRPAEFVIFRIGQWTADRKV